MNVQCHSCIGGTNLGEDIRKLDYGQHIVSGTPGRVFDMIRRRNLRTRSIKMFILDEADEMLNKGRQTSQISSCLSEITTCVSSRANYYICFVQSNLFRYSMPYDVLYCINTGVFCVQYVCRFVGTGVFFVSNTYGVLLLLDRF